MNDTTEAIVRDLGILIDQARWAHLHGYWKEGHGLDAERGTDLSKTEAQREKADTYDLDIGSHPARKAYQEAVIATNRANVVLAAVLASEGTTLQPAVLEIDEYATPHMLFIAAKRATWRAEHITGKHPQLRDVRVRLDKAVRGLSKALDRGAVPYTAHKEKPCRTCGIRDRATKKTECDTCATWRARHGGEARPKRLDEDAINQARAAQQRRLARAEGWGEA